MEIRIYPSVIAKKMHLFVGTAAGGPELYLDIHSLKFVERACVHCTEHSKRLNINGNELEFRAVFDKYMRRWNISTTLFGCNFRVTYGTDLQMKRIVSGLDYPMYFKIETAN